MTRRQERKTKLAKCAEREEKRGEITKQEKEQKIEK